jgi:hypothetical protein
MVLNHDSDALRRYNEMKAAHVGCDMSVYRQAKSQFIEALLASPKAIAIVSTSRDFNPGVYG